MSKCWPGDKRRGRSTSDESEAYHSLKVIVINGPSFKDDGVGDAQVMKLKVRSSHFDVSWMKYKV